VPRSTQDFIPNNAKRRNFVFGGGNEGMTRGRGGREGGGNREGSGICGKE